MPHSTTTRRTFLSIAGLAMTTGLAGCTATESDAQSTPTPAGPETNERVADGVYTDVYEGTIASVALVDAGSGRGTGFLYDDTHLVTNAHVVGEATSAQLRFHDGTWSEGTVQGSDPHSDLAVATVEDVPESSEPLSIADDEPTIGAEVVAIGNPYDLDGSVSSGIISGTDRLIPSPAGYQIPDALQTDAAVNPGNSGGPLMSLDGDVVGVVNSKRGDNIAFGISAALSRRVVPALIDAGEYEHAYIGAAFENVTPTLADANDLPEPRGLLVVQTVDGGPAEGELEPSSPQMGGRRLPVGGDVILSVEGTSMDSFEGLASLLALEKQPGEDIEMTISRDGEERTVSFTLGDRPDRARSPLE